MCISSVFKIHDFISKKSVRSECVKITKMVYAVHPAKGGKGQSEPGVLAT